jgi:hypothetical protein
VSTRRIAASLVSAQTANPPGVTFVAANSANAATITIPTHHTGDMIVIYARQSASAAPPSIPSASGTVPAWVSIGSSGTGYASNRTAYYIATDNTTTSGTWTNANGLIAVVLRRASGVGGYGNSVVGLPAAVSPTISMTKSTGTSALLHFYGWGDAVNTVTSISSTVPGGYTRRTSSTASLTAICLNTKNLTDTDSAVAQAATVNAYSGHATVEVLAS